MIPIFVTLCPDFCLRRQSRTCWATCTTGREAPKRSTVHTPRRAKRRNAQPYMHVEARSAERSKMHTLQGPPGCQLDPYWTSTQPFGWAHAEQLLDFGKHIAWTCTGPLLNFCWTSYWTSSVRILDVYWTSYWAST